MKTMNPKVDEFLNNTKNWHDEMVLLRKILLDCGLTEQLKWKHPCYTFNGGNIVMIGGFKNYCALMLFKGALLKDPEGILIQAGENSQATKQIRFTGTNEIKALEHTIKAYMFEAIEVEKAGLKIDFKKTSEYAVPEEFQEKLDKDPALKKAFKALTPGRQRAYLLHFSSAKQSKTRTARVEKYIPRILNGKGIDDCVCGLSKRMPYCDGSHKNIC